MDADQPIALLAGQPVGDRPVVLHHQREVADTRGKSGMIRRRAEPAGTDQVVAGMQFHAVRQVLPNVRGKIGAMRGHHVAVGGTAFAAQRLRQPAGKLRVIVEADDALGRRVDEAVVGGNDQAGVRAVVAGEEVLKGLVEREQHRQRLLAVTAEAVRSRIEVGIVGIDVAWRGGARDQVGQMREQFRQRRVGARRCATGVPGVERRAGDVLWRDHPAFARHLLENGAIGEQPRRQIFDRKRQRFARLAHRQRQDGQRLPDFLEVHVPSRQPVLRRRARRHEGGYGAGGRRRKHRTERADQMPAQAGRFWQPRQRRQTQSVDDEKNDMPRLCQSFGRQIHAWGIGRGRTARLRNALHQIEDAAAGIVGRRAFPIPDDLAFHHQSRLLPRCGEGQHKPCCCERYRQFVDKCTGHYKLRPPASAIAAAANPDNDAAPDFGQRKCPTETVPCTNRF